MSTQSIYKYPIKAPGTTAVLMPFGAKVLTAQYQGNSLVVWAECKVENSPFRRVFEVVGTGWETDDWDREYVSTVQDVANGYVWHVFEVPQ